MKELHFRDFVLREFKVPADKVKEIEGHLKFDPMEAISIRDLDIMCLNRTPPQEKEQTKSI